MGRRSEISILMDSLPGFDGFVTAFYIKCCDIIKEDVIDAARSFFDSMELPRFI